MNNTTGADPTALSIAALTSVERKREDMGVNRGWENLETEANVEGRETCRKAWLEVNFLIEYKVYCWRRVAAATYR